MSFNNQNTSINLVTLVVNLIRIYYESNWQLNIFESKKKMIQSGIF